MQSLSLFLRMNHVSNIKFYLRISINFCMNNNIQDSFEEKSSPISENDKIVERGPNIFA